MSERNSFKRRHSKGGEGIMKKGEWTKVIKANVPSRKNPRRGDLKDRIGNR
jgi:hypothetical protein